MARKQTMKRVSNGAAAPARRGTKTAPGIGSTLPRDKVFEMYLELGPARSLRRLQEAVALRWPANKVGVATLQRWSKADDWQARIDAYEAGMRSAATANPVPAPVIPIATDGTDDIASLEAAASQALTMALRTTALQVTRPSDVKALVDTANRALDLAAKMKQQRAAVSNQSDLVTLGAELLGRITAARRKDFIALAKAAAEAACSAAGITEASAMTDVLSRAAGALGMRLTADGKFEDAVIEEEQAAAVEAEPDAFCSSSSAVCEVPRAI
jgi:hypothetical protein